jgi:hypothetical protein
MKEVCHGRHFKFLYISFLYLQFQRFAIEVQILLGLEPKFVKKLPLFGKTFIHPPHLKAGAFFRFSFESGRTGPYPHSGIFHGPGQSFLRFQCSGFEFQRFCFFFLTPDTLRFGIWDFTSPPPHYSSGLPEEG